MKVRVIESPNFNGVPGLFAFNGKYDDRDNVIIFKKGEVIGEYTGEFKTFEELQDTYPDTWPSHVYKCDSDLFIDPTEDMCLMAVINSCTDRPDHINAEFSYCPKSEKCHIKAKIDITNLTEIVLP